jgi:trans-aconitate 2-methyltransferase
MFKLNRVFFYLLIILSVDCPSILSGSSGYWSGRDYAKNSLLQQSNVQKALQEIFAWFKSSKPKRILDMGCGNGEHTRALAKQFPDAEVIGFDKSPSMLEEAERGEKLPNLSFILGDIAEMDFSKGKSFDLIVSFYTMHWVEKQLDALKRIQRSLADHGKLYILYAPSKKGLPYARALDKTMRSNAWKAKFNDFVDPKYNFDCEQYRQFLVDAGLTVEEIRYTLDHKVFPTSEALKNWCKQWNQQMKHLKSTDQKAFLDDLFEQYFAIVPLDETGRAHWEEYFVTAIAIKHQSALSMVNAVSTSDENY